MTLILNFEFRCISMNYVELHSKCFQIQMNSDKDTKSPANKVLHRKRHRFQNHADSLLILTLALTISQRSAIIHTKCDIPNNNSLMMNDYTPQMSLQADHQLRALSEPTKTTKYDLWWFFHLINLCVSSAGSNCDSPLFVRWYMACSPIWYN